MLPLRCNAQTYEWGRTAANSEVAQLAQANGVDVDDNKPYAELWMGTHPNCPSRLGKTGEVLQEWIASHAEALGSDVTERFGVALPFLFKVLSVNKALSIQSHPDKQLAERLHREHPKLYPDDNHKPEMALAISDDFEALCGFAPLSTITSTLRSYPELARLVGEARISALESAHTQEEETEALRSAFTAVMTAPQSDVSSAVSDLVTRLTASTQPLTARDRLALRLNTQYPGGDVGVLSSFFLNYVTLSAGQALYLGANEPHAYLAGELVECMASSDNVIRAGLTPKFKHAEVLCQSLTYRTGLPDILEGDLVPGSSTRVYRPPTEEFEIRCVTVDTGAKTVLPADPGPQLVLVQSGAGQADASLVHGVGASGDLETHTTLTRGKVFFVPAGTQVDVSGVSSPLKLWIAAVNKTFFQLKAAVTPSVPTKVGAPVSNALPVEVMAL